MMVRNWRLVHITQDYTPEQLEAIKIADAIMQLKSHKLVKPVLGPEHTVCPALQFS
jgi:hypothetical protein